jgi:hypothetical protein
MEADKEEFKRLAVKLVVVHKVEHAALLSVIRKAIREEADKQPKIQVLYCGSYGGFGYSKQYGDFVKQPSDCNLKKIEDIERIELFANKCAKEYPNIEKMIKLYKHHDLENTFDILSSILYLKNEIDRIEPNRILILNTNKGYGDENIMEHEPRYEIEFEIKSNKMNISKYTKVSLFEAIDQETKKCNIEINELMEKLEKNLPIN